MKDARTIRVIPLETPRQQQVMEARVEIAIQTGSSHIPPGETARLLQPRFLYSQPPSYDTVDRTQRRIREATVVEDPHGVVLERGMSPKELDEVTASAAEMERASREGRIPRLTVRRR